MNSGELNDKEIYEVEGRITEKGLNESSTRIIPPKCILIGLAGQGRTRGTVAINYVELCTNQSIAAIFPSMSHDSEYLYFNLDSRYKELRGLSTGGEGRGGLNLSIIRQILVAFPGKDEQKAIASALVDTDALITKVESLIGKKKQIKQGVMEELLTGKRRLSGFSFKWQEARLEVLFTLSTTYSKTRFVDPGGSFLIMDMGSVSSNGRMIASKRTFLSADLLKTGELVMPKDDIGGGNIIGKVVYIDQDNTYVLGDHVYRLTPKTQDIDSMFFSYLINSAAINRKLRTKVAGSAQLGLSRNSVLEEIIYFPEGKSEQSSIACILRNLDSGIQKLEMRLAKYQKVKQGMMEVLLTGKIRLI